MLAAVERIGWRVKRQAGSHKLLAREGWLDCEFTFHDMTNLAARSRAVSRNTRACSQKIYKILPLRGRPFPEAMIRKNT